ncbi:NUDIX hydrolase [Haloechinothrix sp. LS1_15]|uniref:NUDIX hydrolase n=1 Tax=Haloechinothrix sp. LS1_15 TaxID=2652248 RepID=UPI002946211F|nr:NUDIX hydrolase [Haloechinothrix sp. LS1_15]MDV6012114.1 NUDIX hydrolase [Haloechinothrix sp. LS1_15]
MNSQDEDDELTRWTIHGERVVDDSRKMVVSIASVELPDGVQFEQYVFRSPPVAMVVAINERDEVLMIWRHRFIMDRWTWELPGGYIDPAEDSEQAAARELEEEAGWRAGSLRLLARFQPLAGSIDMENHVYLAEDLEAAGNGPDINETAKVEWVPLSSVPDRIAKGEVIGAGAQLGLLHAARLRSY